MRDKKSFRIRPWWSGNVQAWFTWKASDPTLTTEQIARLQRLADDSRMKRVAEFFANDEKALLASIGVPPDAASISRSENFLEDPDAPDPVLSDRSVQFIQAAWESPDNWQVEAKKKRTNRTTELKKFSKQCTDFVSFLYRERVFAQYWFLFQGKQPSVNDWLAVHDRDDVEKLSPENMRRSKEQLDSLMSTLKGFSKSINEGFKLFIDPLEYKGPTIRDSPFANENYCIRHLVARRSMFFLNPAIEDIAVTVSVALDSPEEIDCDRVKKVWIKFKKKEQEYRRKFASNHTDKN